MIVLRAIEIEPSHPKRVFFEVVLKFVERSNLLPSEDFALPSNDGDKTEVSFLVSSDLPDSFLPIGNEEDESSDKFDNNLMDGGKEAKLWLEAVGKKVRGENTIESIFVKFFHPFQMPQ